MTSAVLVWIHGVIQLVHERLRCVGVPGSFFPDELLLKRDSRFFLPALSFGLETFAATRLGPRIRPSTSASTGDGAGRPQESSRSRWGAA